MLAGEFPAGNPRVEFGDFLRGDILATANVHGVQLAIPSPAPRGDCRDAHLLDKSGQADGGPQKVGFAAVSSCRFLLVHARSSSGEK